MIILSRKEWNENNLEFYLDNWEDKNPSIDLFFKKMNDQIFKLVKIEKRKNHPSLLHLEEIEKKADLMLYRSKEIFSGPWTSVEISNESLNKIIDFYKVELLEKEKSRIESVKKEKQTRNIVDNGSILSEKGFTELLYLVRQENVASILERGILSKNEVKKKKLEISDFSLATAQDRREGITDKFYKKKLHDYVPLCFTQKLPMLYSIKDQQNDLVIMHIDTQSVIKENRCLFSDGNMASPLSDHFENYIDDDGLYSLIKTESWNRFANENIKKAAEVLIDSVIALKYINSISCYSDQTYEKIYPLGAAYNVQIKKNKELFFKI